MSRVIPRRLDPDTRMKYLDLLWTTIAELETRDEVKNFFKDLLSETEAVMLARRIRIAQYLLEGRSYDEIMQELKTSQATVAKVHQWLTSGFGGYEQAIKKFESALKRRFKKSRPSPAAPYSFEWLKKKYPFHFALFNLLESEQPKN